MFATARGYGRWEEALREIVADYFDASEQADKTRATAQHKAETIRSQAEERIAAIHKKQTPTPPDTCPAPTRRAARHRRQPHTTNHRTSTRHRTPRAPPGTPTKPGASPAETTQ
ncbi:MAG TPA: hypothetical protein VFU74_11890 [Actinocrinis sp.]|nr:hypothetical protein [Actinocrinis sp.]